MPETNEALEAVTAARDVLDRFIERESHAPHESSVDPIVAGLAAASVQHGEPVELVQTHGQEHGDVQLLLITYSVGGVLHYLVTLNGKPSTGVEIA